MKSRSDYLNYSYALVCITYLVGLFFLPDDIQLAMKYSLMPVLILGVLLQKKLRLKPWLIGALVASWIGDIVIAHAPKGEIYFLAGLCAFLVAHICYFLLFKKSTSSHPQIRGYPTQICGGVLIFFLIMQILILPKVGSLAIPVCIYSIVIVAMLFAALRGWAHWPLEGGNWIVLGAASFIVSDSILAFNKFLMPLPYAAFLIMVTYLFAQWAIVKGVSYNNYACK